MRHLDSLPPEVSRRVVGKEFSTSCGAPRTISEGAAIPEKNSLLPAPLWSSQTEVVKRRTKQLPQAQAGAEGHGVKDVVSGILVNCRLPEQTRLLGGRHRLGGAETGEHGSTRRAAGATKVKAYWSTMGLIESSAKDSDKGHGPARPHLGGKR